MSMAPLEWRFMNVAAISGLFALACAVAGWSLNQLGLRLARGASSASRISVTRTSGCSRPRRPRPVSARLSDGSSRSTGTDIACEGPSHATYEQVVVEAQSELRRLREALLGITIKGPDGSAPGLERIIATAQELWNKYVPASPGQSIGEEPQPWLAGCNSLVAAAQSWAQQHSSLPRARTHERSPA